MNRIFSLPAGVPSDAFFDGMPQEAREFLAAGFSTLANLPTASSQDIASQASRWLDPQEPEPEIGALADRFGVGRDDMTRIISAVSLLASAQFAEPSAMGFDAFVSQATNAGILTASSAASIQAFSETLFGLHRVAVSFALARAHSSTRVVPSFRYLATAVDLRVAAIDDERLVTAPVVMATLRTDVEGQEQIFQMTPRDVGQLARQLQDLAEELSRFKNATTRLAPKE